ncbi:hypothetical protein [Streptomyces atratus]|uniref:hypothetical protein n=1 Tax=Streptomyces atratus TaxID=1893 RepID=UPI003251A6B5
MQWEVEALEPVELKRLVLAAVSPYTDRDVLARQTAREEAQRRALAAFLDRWDAAGGGSTVLALPARMEAHAVAGGSVRTATGPTPCFRRSPPSWRTTGGETRPGDGGHAEPRKHPEVPAHAP